MQELEAIPLNPILEPNPVAFTMETIGWKVLLIGLLSLIIYSIYKYYIHYKKNKYRRDAIVNIDKIIADINSSVPEIITQVLFQLKQTALISYGRKKVASLEGEEWLIFLESSANGVQFLKYQETISLALYNGQIKKEIPFDKELFIKSSLLWIRKHAR